MTNAERLALFQKALVAVERLESEYPSYPPFVSIHNQLLYLVRLVSGQAGGGAELAKINLGYIAMREVEPRDEAAATLLYSVAAEVDLMKKQRQL